MVNLEPTVAAVSTRAGAAARPRRGADVDALLARYGLDLEALRAPGCRLPSRAVGPIWLEAARLAGEPELPVWAAIELGWGAYRVIDLLAASAATFGEAMQALSDYFRIVNEAIQLPITPRADGFSVGIAHRSGAPLPAAYVDYTLAACVYRLSRVGAVVHPAVYLTRPAPADDRGHRRAMGGPVHFGAPENRIDFSAAHRELPMPTADPVLRSVLGEHADRLLTELPAAAPGSLQDVVVATWDALPRGRAELVYVAGRLQIAPRTLQRRLSEQGLTWRVLLARVRRELAEQLLHDPGLSVEEIALLVGYGEASAFARAFRGWTGLTPGAWRQAGGPAATGTAP